MVQLSERNRQSCSPKFVYTLQYLQNVNNLSSKRVESLKNCNFCSDEAVYSARCM